MAKREWTPKQRQCFECHDGTLLVSAAAGSGKTAVLIKRIMERITSAENPIDIDRILVVTFTNAAAAEMRQRLSAALIDAIAADPDNLRLQEQQIRLPRATISTVDSFCIGLVRENFSQLGISPLFKIAEAGQLLLLQKDALAETIDAFYEQAHPDFLQLANMFSDGKSDYRLAALIERVYTYTRSYPDPEQWLTDSASLYAASDRIADTVWGKRMLTHIADSLDHAVRLCDAALQATRNDAVLAAKYTAAVTDDRSVLQAAKRAAENGEWDTTFIALNDFAIAAPDKQKDFTDVEANARILALRHDVESTVKELCKLTCGDEAACRDDLQITARLTAQLFDMVRHFTAVLDKKKQAANVLDFSDTTHLALQLLTEVVDGKRVPTPMARELSEQFDEIMVDEYQDTNAVQDALFCALSRDERNLFFVGDVKQSIYAFRQAMPQLFIDRRNRYPEFDGEHYPGTITLGNNFRSRKTVTDIVNFVFRQIMTAQVGGITYDDHEQLVFSAHYREDDPVEPYVTECIVVDETCYDSRRFSKDEAEAHVIAEEILRLKQEAQVFTDEDSPKRPFAYRDCCILLRSRESHVGAYRKVLEQYGIPVIAQSKGGFFDAAEIRLVLSLLRCIDNPLLDIPFTAVMLSPIFAFSPDDLTRIRLYRPDVPLYMATSAARRHPDAVLAARCTHLVTLLDRYRTLSALLTVDRLVSRLYDDLALPELLCARFGGENRTENLRRLHEMCTRFEQGGFRGLSVFVRYIDRLQEQRQDLPSSPGNVTDAVRIMSIHGSKGLEFPYVFLAGLSVGFNDDDTRQPLLTHSHYGIGMTLRDNDTLARHTTLPRQGILLARKTDDRAEALRVLYVGMTRAREKLYLMLHTKSAAKTFGTLAASLDPQSPTLPAQMIREGKSLSDWIGAALLRHPDAIALRHAAATTEQLVIDDKSPLRVRFAEPHVAESVEDTPSPTVPADEELVEQLRARMQYAYPHEALSRVPTKMAASEAAADPTRPELVAHARPSFLSQTGLTPAERGTATHRFLQFADFGCTDVEAEIERLLAGGFLTAPEAKALDRKRLAAFFGGDLCRRMRTAEQVMREYHFTCRQPAAVYDPSVTDATEFMVLQGMVDCAFVENGELVIVDYKTDRVTSPDELTARYSAQLGIYAKALSVVLGLPIKECLLYSFALGRTVKI